MRWSLALLALLPVVVQVDTLSLVSKPATASSVTSLPVEYIPRSTRAPSGRVLLAAATTDGPQSWMTKPNFPVSDQLPTEATPSIPGLKLNAGAVSLAAMTFTPGGTTDTRAKLDAQVYYSPFTGNQEAVVASSPGDPIDGSNQPSWTRFRRYPAGSPFDLHTFNANGLHLNQICSQNNTAAGCTPGHVYGGMIRLPTEILPGDTIYVRAKFSGSPFSWTSLWTFEGSQFTPGPGGKPYANGFNTPGALIQGETGSCYFEYDIQDHFLHSDVSVRKNLNTSYVDRKNPCRVVPPHDVYRANGPVFEDHKNNGFPFSALAAKNGIFIDDRFHDWVFNWHLHDHLVDVLFDGKLFVTQYWEYRPSSYVDASGVSHPVAQHLLLTTDGGPTFTDPSRTGALRSPVPNDGTPVAGGAWSLGVQVLKIIRGNVSAASLAAATSDVNGS